MTIIEIPRTFAMKQNSNTILLDDPNPLFTPEEVMDFYSHQYPELITASITGPEIKLDSKIYTFSTVLGTKG